MWGDDDYIGSRCWTATRAVSLSALPSLPSLHMSDQDNKIDTGPAVLDLQNTLVFQLELGTYPWINHGEVLHVGMRTSLYLTIVLLRYPRTPI